MSYQDVSVLSSDPCPSFPRPEKDGAATGVDAICTHRPDPAGRMLDSERLYWELSQQTHSVTWLGPYLLDRDRLYVNGEHLAVTVVSSCTAGGCFCWCSELCPEDATMCAFIFLCPHFSFLREVPLPHHVCIYHTHRGRKKVRESL